MNTKKRKIDNENRRFQSEWEELYFFIAAKNKAICLLCQDSINNFKLYNLKRHYDQKHNAMKELSVSERKAKLSILKEGLLAQQNVFQKQAAQSNAVVTASFRISNIIAKNMKPFTDGDYIKECLISAVQELVPEKVQMFNQISLSHQTVTRRINNISQEICLTLDTKSKNFEYFSLTLDESTDLTDTAQLAIFIRGVNSAMEVTEEFLDLASLKNTTTGRDIKEAVFKCMEDHQLDIKKLIGITTDGAPSMVGKNIGAVNLIRRHLEEFGVNPHVNDMFIFNCFLHLQNLCAQVLNMNHVMSVVVRTINTIKNNSLKHRQFHEFIREMESEYGDLIFYSKIRWLSRGKCLERFYNLIVEIRIFMKDIGDDVPELYDDKWLLDLSFLTDISVKLNELNRRLQGEDKLITECYQDIKTFVAKLKFHVNQLKSHKTIHFPLLHNLDIENKDCSKYADEILKLQTAFQQRFVHLQKYEKIFNIFSCPFLIDVQSAPENLQMELIDLQSSMELKYVFESMDKLEFYRKYIINDDKFPNLKHLAMRITAAMGTTYLCEFLFSKMKFVKSKNRNKLTDENLKNALRCASSKINVDLNKLADKLQKQVSH